MLKKTAIILFSTYLMVCSFLAFTGESSLPSNYQQLPAKQKRHILWSRLVNTEFDRGNRPSHFPYARMVNLFNPVYLVKTFLHESDELPRGRKKIIHARGSVAKIRFVVTARLPYTGVFKTGAIGVTRLSLATPVGAYTPGLGLKFLRDGKSSVNIFVMNSLDGQGGNRNFFEKPFFNELDTPSNPLLRKAAIAFDKAVKKIGRERTPFYLPLNHMSGKEGVSPAVMKLVPVGASFDPDSKQDLRDQLATISKGTILYDVYVSANRKPNLKWRKIGFIQTESRFVASDYGDSKLFFQHH